MSLPQTPETPDVTVLHLGVIDFTAMPPKALALQGSTAVAGSLFHAHSVENVYPVGFAAARCPSPADKAVLCQSAARISVPAATNTVIG